MKQLMIFVYGILFFSGSAYSEELPTQHEVVITNSGFSVQNTNSATNTVLAAQYLYRLNSMFQIGAYVNYSKSTSNINHYSFVEPTLGLNFSPNFEESVFVTLGLGSINYTTAQTDNYTRVHLGKRFPVFSNVSWRPYVEYTKFNVQEYPIVTFDVLAFSFNF